MKGLTVFAKEWRILAIVFACFVCVGMALLSIYGPLLQQKLYAQQSPSSMGTTPTGVQQGQPTIVVQNQHILAEDTFQRLDQQGWITASDGQSWQEGPIAKLPLFAVRNNVGEIAGSQSKVTALLGPVSFDADVSAVASISSFRQSAVNIGIVLRYSSPNEWYKVHIDGTHLMLIRRDGSGTTTLASVPFSAQSNTLYTIRFRVTGRLLEAKAWKGTLEPTWMVQATDGTQRSGYAGIRVVIQPTLVVRVTHFVETLAQGGLQP